MFLLQRIRPTECTKFPISDQFQIRFSARSSIKLRSLRSTASINRSSLRQQQQQQQQPH